MNRDARFRWHLVNSWSIHAVNIRRWVGSVTLGGDSLFLFKGCSLKKALVAGKRELQLGRRRQDGKTSGEGGDD